jgi:DNA-directed RNA polymerase II subunit RPB2
MSWDEWQTFVEVRGDLLMVPVASIERLPLMAVADITVESDNHSFIGGDGFAVSNSAMGKQAVGIYASNFNNRTDTMAHVLHYPQKPLTRTHLSKYVNSEQLPSGNNAIVAIATPTGFNQEDSVMVNQSAIDRGLFTSTYYKSYRDQCSKNHSTGEEEIFMRPIVDNGGIGKGKPKPFNYDKLGEDGFVPKNTYVDSSDILVGKVMPQKVHGSIQYRDTSMQIKGNDDGYVHTTYTGTNGDGYKFCKVRMRKYRKPTVGDKLASRHAQKGTIGMVYSDADMPFTKEGIKPDIIMNPHAVPSRMTIAQLLECIMSKTGCHIGACGDASPFNNCNVESIASILEKCGYERYGNEILYNGRTGQQIQTEIFIGPTYYQRLKHMVSDKQHSRSSNGPIVLLTRQPAEGRSRNGGLRFGEMERDGIVGHGAGLFLKERMLDVSDNFRVFPCRKCGLIAVANPEKNIYRCGSCKSSADICQVRMPYSMALLLKELESMSVALRLCF